MTRRSMPTAVAERLTADLASARDEARSGNAAVAWTLLEEAHVLSQPWAWPHVKVHAAMLALALGVPRIRRRSCQCGSAVFVFW